MVRCAVPADDGGVPPMGIALVELQHQLLHEEGHHTLVRVRLGEGEVDIT